MSAQEMFDEVREAIKLANAVLDNHSIDPDGDISILARQFLRSIEREGTAVNAHAGLLAAAKGAVELHNRKSGSASEFDERYCALKTAIRNAEESAP